MTCKVWRDFKRITDELSRVSRQFHWWHRTFGDLRFVSQNLYIRKQVTRFWESWRQLSKQAHRKVPRPRPVLPSLLRPICQAGVNNQLLPTPPSPPRGREKKNVTKMNFSSCNDHSPKWMINDCYIFFRYLRVWVFLFLRTSFFTAQHVGPMLQKENFEFTPALLRFKKSTLCPIMMVVKGWGKYICNMSAKEGENHELSFKQNLNFYSFFKNLLKVLTRTILNFVEKHSRFIMKAFGATIFSQDPQNYSYSEGILFDWIKQNQFCYFGTFQEITTD